MSAYVNHQAQIAAAQAAANLFAATPDSDNKEEVTIEQARQLYNAVNDLNQHNATLEAQLTALQHLEQRLNNIENYSNPRPVNCSQRTAKVGRLPCFDRTKQEELQGFVTQLRSYFQFHLDKFDKEFKKVLFAATYLKGRALKWFKPTQQEFLEKSPDKQSPKTNNIFKYFANFEDALTKVFRLYNKRAKVETDLNNLRQNKSAIKYALQFRQLAFRVQQGEDTLKRRFYNSLKDNIKDKLIKINCNTKTLDKYINNAITIDNRQFEQHQERQGLKGTQYTYSKANQGKKRALQYAVYSTYTRPIDVSAVQQGLDYAKKDKSTVTCFSCRKKGHYKQDCRSVKKLGNQKPALLQKHIDIIDKHIQVVKCSIVNSKELRDNYYRLEHNVYLLQDNTSIPNTEDAEEYNWKVERQDQDSLFNSRGSKPSVESVPKQTRAERKATNTALQQQLVRQVSLSTTYVD